MKKVFLGMAALAFLFTSCDTDKDGSLQEEQSVVDMSDFYVHTESSKENDLLRAAQGDKSCATMSNLNRMLEENPGLEKKMYNIEYHTRKHLAKGKPTNPGGGGGDTGGDDVDVAIVPDNLGVINIPVYIHIVYPNPSVISQSQINSQIATLNSDFSSTNVNQLPSGTTFANDATDAGFSFSVAGVFTYADSRTSWGTNNAVKSAYPPITPETHLNIWVCEIGGGILGYAQFPGGNLSTDGIVIGGNYFGDTNAQPYNQGRTATHEVGHYLNLRHIWGDGRCRQDDFVLDTPSSDASNGGCPSFPSVSCQTADMTMNYMDYTYDACMYMFTDGQRNRMRAIFQPGGPRASMLGN